MEVITVEGVKYLHNCKSNQLYKYSECVDYIKTIKQLNETLYLNSNPFSFECIKNINIDSIGKYNHETKIITYYQMHDDAYPLYYKQIIDYVLSHIEISTNQIYDMDEIKFQMITIKGIKYLHFLKCGSLILYKDCIARVEYLEKISKIYNRVLYNRIYSHPLSKMWTIGIYDSYKQKIIHHYKYVMRFPLDEIKKFIQKNDPLIIVLENVLNKDSIVDKIETKPPEQPKIKEAMNQPPKDNINLCFVGGVSTGKSTILNAVFSEQLTQCKIKRTTMVPTIYVENDVIEYDQTAIYKTISDKNQEMIEKSENGIPISKDDYQELIFNVGKLDINILPDAFVNVYDIPGLNDARTKNIYYEYLETNFHKFNMVIFLVDIHSGLNTSDEIDILNFITNNTKYQMEKNNRKIFTLVVVNKADDMQFNEETHKLEFTGEMKEMYEQVQKTIHDEFKRKQVESQLIDIIPLCAIDAYLYRMVQKHGHKFKLTPEQILKIGINENGKKFSTLKPDVQEKKVYEILNDENFIDTMIQLSGFSQFEEILNTFLNENDTGKSIRIDNLLYDLRKLPTIKYHMRSSKSWFNLEDFKYIVNEYIKIYKNVKKIDMEMYKQLNNDMNKEIEEILNCFIYNWSFDKQILLDKYDEFINDIIISYLTNYNTEYPLCLKTKIMKMIEDEFKGSITTKLLIQNFNLLKKLKMFTSQKCYNLIAILLKNERKEKTLVVNDVNLLLSLLDDMIALDMNISNFVRFLIINQLNSNQYTDDVLMMKKMLYYKFKEIPIYHYLQIYTANITLFIYGMDDFENSEEYKLDIYYLEQCKDSVNFN